MDLSQKSYQSKVLYPFIDKGHYSENLRKVKCMFDIYRIGPFGRVIPTQTGIQRNAEHMQNFQFRKPSHAFS